MWTGFRRPALVEVIGPHTSGNPYETVELLHVLRRDGVLAATAEVAVGRGGGARPAGPGRARRAADSAG